MNKKDFKTEIREKDGKFEAYIEGELLDVYGEFLEAEDEIEDALIDRLKSDNKYCCDFCDEYFLEKDVEHRIEDRRFTAPYGSTFVLGGNVGSVAVCPICGDDLEEC